MKLVTMLVVLFGGLGLALAAQCAPQHAHPHHAAPDTAGSTVPLPAQRFAPDASLKVGLRRAYTAVDQVRHYEMGHMGAPMAADRAGEVEAAVTYMFTHCKLAGSADAALHSILVPLMGAAQALKADPQHSLAAVAEMRQILARYPQYFVDPGWNQPLPVEHATHDEP